MLATAELGACVNNVGSYIRARSQSWVCALLESEELNPFPSLYLTVT